jgi:hypothetical protein
MIPLGRVLSHWLADSFCGFSGGQADIHSTRFALTRFGPTNDVEDALCREKVAFFIDSEVISI